MRVTNMAGVDLSVYRFDYDLTFAALLMNADGTIYHVYGGRDSSDAMSHLTIPSFARVLRETLADHAAYRKAPHPPKAAPKLTVEKLKRQARIKKTPECFHCHMVHGWMREAGRLRRTWKRRDNFVWPDPAQLGLSLDKEGQVLVSAIAPGSAAGAAGLQAGDKLVELGGRMLRTFGDIQRALQETPWSARTLPVRWERAGTTRTAGLKLKKKWKQATPRAFAWRPLKWGLTPAPGFGGRALTPDQREAAGLARDRFAMRVGYLVTWGNQAELGRTARRAGLRKGDLILSIDGKSDFESEAHVQAWFRLALRPGQKVKIELMRAGRKKTITLPVAR